MASAQPTNNSLARTWRRLSIRARRANIILWLEIACAIGFAAMALTTYLAFSNAPPNGELLPSSQVTILLVGALVPAFGLLILYGRRKAIKKAAGNTARLHVRLVFLFSIIAAVPTLLFAAFAALLFQTGVDFWFSDDSRGLMENANQLARGYYEQNQLDLGNETIAMAGDMRDYLERMTIFDADFPTYYGFQAQARDMSESVILQEMPDGTTRTAAVLNLREDNDPALFVRRNLSALKAGQGVYVEGGPARIEAVAAVDQDSGIYLYNARNSDTNNFNFWRRAESISNSYDHLRNRARALQLRLNLALFLASLALVGLAVWFALRVADRQVQPLNALVAAARQVGQGNFTMRIDGRTRGDEIGVLNRAFNRMTGQLEVQRRELVEANRQLEERSSFIEAVLESVSAGIISTDRDGRVQLMNSSAQRILFDRLGPLPAGLHLRDISPEIAELADGEEVSGLVNFLRHGERLTLVVKVGYEKDGYVVTFDDITRQLVDQRQAAWSDVARRIAHEIKNPLTPIQLATERLKRRYRSQITENAELFDDLTHTIVRQVSDLRKMVDEFSSFARLPKPVFRQEDAYDLVRQAVFLQEVAHPKIGITVDSETPPPIMLSCDRHQLGQALTNVLKNAVEAIEAKEALAGRGYRGQINVTVADQAEAVVVVVADNGVGLPNDAKRIVEPYVTTREKGTGLGLAIVNKIVEEHGGDMAFATQSGGGAAVTLRFAKALDVRTSAAAE